MQLSNTCQVGKITYFGRLLALTTLCGFVIVGCGGEGDSDSDPSSVTEVVSDPSVVTDANKYYSGSANCSFCHDGLTDTTGNDISIVTAWSSSMMANATRDPYWQAKVASELKRTPQLDGFINDACSRCHAPMANDSARKEGIEPRIFDQGFLSPDNLYFDHAMDGVSCTLCHQISDNGLLGLPEGTSGEFQVDIHANKVARPAYGEYADPIADPMRFEVEFTPQLGTHTGTSELCASCHDLKTPTVDDSGVLTGGEFPEQMVFTEWENSDFRTGGTKEQTCQACHMPEVGSPVKIANRPRWLAPRTGFSTHDMLGANTVMLDILNSNRLELGVTAQGFAQAIERNRAFLKTAATLELLSAGLAGGELTLDLQITNLTGHKLPTSYPARRMFIHLVVQDDRGAMLFESGAVNSDGSVVGLNTDSDNTTYEPHYDEIISQNQVQVYEPIMMDPVGNVVHSLLRAAGYVKDNRLPPSGFDKDLLVSSDVPVVGAAMSDDDFNSGSDTVTYRISVGSNTKLTVTAELKYQTLSFGHLQNLFEDTELEQVARLKRMFDTAAIRAETIASTSGTIN